MAATPLKIICIGIVWVFYLIRTFLIFLKTKLNNLIHNIKFIYISFKYSDEESFINSYTKNNNLVYPKNIALIMNKFLISKEKIYYELLNFINWISYTNQIKYLTIYDPFNLIDTKEFTQKLEDSNKNKVNFILSFTEPKNKSHIKKYINFNVKNTKKTEETLYISILNFEDSNQNLLKKIVYEKNKKVYNNYPSSYVLTDKILPYNETKYEKEFQKYLTRKNEESLPELIIAFGKNKYLFYEDLCLYGFPFTLLENAEILNINNKQFDHLDVLDFINIFKKNANITKRFGV